MCATNIHTESWPGWRMLAEFRQNISWTSANKQHNKALHAVLCGIPPGGPCETQQEFYFFFWIYPGSSWLVLIKHSSKPVLFLGFLEKFFRWFFFQMSPTSEIPSGFFHEFFHGFLQELFHSFLLSFYQDFHPTSLEKFLSGIFQKFFLGYIYKSLPGLLSKIRTGAPSVIPPWVHSGIISGISPTTPPGVSSEILPGVCFNSSRTLFLYSFRNTLCDSYTIFFLDSEFVKVFFLKFIYLPFPRIL